MDWAKKEPWIFSLADPGRRLFLKLGAAASASLMFGCSGNLTRSRDSRITLLKGDREWAPSVCTLCPSGCAIRAYSESGRVVAVGGDPDDPNTGGRMCPVGLSVLNLHNNPDRLTGAMQKSPEGKMVPAQAEEVLAAIAGKIRSGKALHIYGRITPFASYLSKTLNAACHLDPVYEGVSAYPGLLNTDGRPPVVDFVNARIALLFNSNILEHGNPYVGYVRRIAEARMRGLRLITISPFLTNTATAGDWIPLRAQSAVSAASLAVAQQALDDASQRVSVPSPEIAALLRSLDGKFLESASGLSRDAIQEISRRFFSEPGPAISNFPDPAVLLLNIMKGNLNRPGGLFHPGQRALSVDAETGDIARMLSEPRNVVLLHQSNPAFSLSSRIRPILGSSDRATVVCIDSFLSETAELSDFVLPLASPLETLTIAEPIPLEKPFIAAAAPAVPPQKTSLSLDEWLTRLAAAVKGSAPPLTPERFAVERIPGISSGKLAADRSVYPMASNPAKALEANMPAVISSLKRQIVFVPHIPKLQQEQFFVSVFEESVQGPATAPSKWLDEITYSPKLYLNPKRAGRLGISNGDSVTVISGSGVILSGIVLLFEGVHPDTLAIPEHHGHTGYGRVALGESFSDSKDPDMTRMFWGKNRGVNAADIYGSLVTIRKKRG